MRQMKTQLREVSAVRCVGFGDAVRDLGTHMMCGREVEYSRAQVYKVLQGKTQSVRLMKLIAEKRPDLFGLRFVCDSVKRWYADYRKEAR